MPQKVVRTTPEIQNRGGVRSQNMLQLEVEVPQTECHEYQLSPLEETRNLRFKYKLFDPTE